MGERKGRTHVQSDSEPTPSSGDMHIYSETAVVTVSVKMIFAHTAPRVPQRAATRAGQRNVNRSEVVILARETDVARY